jgi:acetyltransferase-like isoleucine patch superfamily enzyme
LRTFFKKIISNSAHLAQLASRLFFLGRTVLSLMHSVRMPFAYFVDRRARIIGWRNVSFGKNCAIGADVVINVNDRSSDRIAVLVGDNVSLGRGCFVAVGHSVVFNHYAMVAPACSFIGSSHVIADPSLPYARSGVTLNHDIRIGVNCWIGHGATVIGDVSIGWGAVIGANTLVNRDIPPFAIAVGNPAQVIKRFCFKTHEWVAGDGGPDYTCPSEDEYLQALRDKVKYFPQPLAVLKSGWGDI